ncbi:MAG: deoxyribose-phosphate aldolase [Clostridiales bacterium]|nr:deoxyribose-phosphate aldolase [Clostridiales bacterium]
MQYSRKGVIPTDNKEILGHVDHTLLAAYATSEDILKLCGEALEYGTASVCIPPAYVSLAKAHFPTLNVCTVIGFPLGYSSTSAKLSEIIDAKESGCDEFDMVINISWAKNGMFDKITDEISALKKAVGDKTLKVIVETCYLTEDEKIALCKCVTDGHADYIKTSTGFGTAGAALADVELFKKHIGRGIKIKASGGVRTRADMEAFLSAGCDRIGTSGAVAALSD